MNEQITGALFKRMVLHGAAVITAQKQAINDLNVFPVPDGDTGTPCLGRTVCLYTKLWYE